MARIVLVVMLLIVAWCGLSHAAPEPEGATAAYFSANGQTLFLGHADGTLSVWRGQPWRRSQRIKACSDAIRSIAVIPGESHVAAGAASGVTLVDLVMGKSYATLKSARPPIAFNVSGDTLFTNTVNGRAVQPWGMDSHGAARLRLSYPQVGRVWDISPNATVIAGAKGDWDVRLWHVQRGGGVRLGKTVKSAGMWGGNGKVRFSPDSRLLITMGSTISKPPDGFAQTYDVKTGKEIGYLCPNPRKGKVWGQPSIRAVGAAPASASGIGSSFGSGSRLTWGHSCCPT